MKTITIREPIWKNRSVGIASRELTEDDIAVKITYKDKSGRIIYPATYKMRKSIIERYPTQVRKGVKLHIIPIEAFKI